MRAFQRLYTYLSQINTAIEKRSIFYKQVLRLLEFGREREGIDLSKVVLTHHSLKSRGKQPMPLAVGEHPKLEPITEVGSGVVQEKQKAYLNEIIRRVNDLFEGDLTEQDKLVYVNDVIKGKLLESETLKQQGQQYERTVRQLAGFEHRTHECHHGRSRSPHRNEQPSAAIGNRPEWLERCIVGPRTAL